MKALDQYVEYANRWRTLTKQEPITLSSPAHLKELADRVGADLSPENLTCDGELSRTEVNRRYTHLQAVKKDLLKLDPSLKFYE